MVRSTLTLLALFNVAILFPGKAMSQNSEGREFNGKYQKEYLDKIAFPIGESAPECSVWREPVPFRMCLSDTILM